MNPFKQLNLFNSKEKKTLLSIAEQRDLELRKEKIEKANKFIDSFDVNSLTEQKDEHDEITKELDEVLRQINYDEKKMDVSYVLLQVGFP